MLDAEPVEVAAIQGDELRDVKQQLAVIKSLYLPKPGKKAHQTIGIGGQPLLGFSRESRDRLRHSSAKVSPTDSMPGHYKAVRS